MARRRKTQILHRDIHITLRVFALSQTAIDAMDERAVRNTLAEVEEKGTDGRWYPNGVSRMESGPVALSLLSVGQAQTPPSDGDIELVRETLEEG